jgi:nitrite reductase (NO-forming)
MGYIAARAHPVGGPTPQTNVQTTEIPSGGAAIVEFRVEVPGTYSMVDHAIFRAFAKGAVGQLVVSGDPVPEIYSGQQSDISVTQAER